MFSSTPNITGSDFVVEVWISGFQICDECFHVLFSQMLPKIAPGDGPNVIFVNLEFFSDLSGWHPLTAHFDDLANFILGELYLLLKVLRCLGVPFDLVLETIPEHEWLNHVNEVVIGLFGKLEDGHVLMLVL